GRVRGDRVAGDLPPLLEQVAAAEEGAGSRVDGDDEVEVADVDGRGDEQEEPGAVGRERAATEGEGGAALVPRGDDGARRAADRVDRDEAVVARRPGELAGDDDLAVREQVRAEDLGQGRRPGRADQRARRVDGRHDQRTVAVRLQDDVGAAVRGGDGGDHLGGARDRGGEVDGGPHDRLRDHDGRRTRRRRSGRGGRGGPGRWT